MLRDHAAKLADLKKKMGAPGVDFNTEQFNAVFDALNHTDGLLTALEKTIQTHYENRREVRK